MSESFQRLKGFADIYDEPGRKYALMEKCAREIFFRYGFSELRTPLLEQTALFQRSIGSETDVVQKEMFTFSDSRGRPMSLRPEATAGVMRACVENSLARQGSVSRYFTIGPMFRHERPQKGRMRQFHQVNCECLGSESPVMDAEIIVMLMNFLHSLKIPDLVLKINSLGCPECRKKYLDELKSWLGKEENSTFCPDCLRRSQTNPLRVLDCKQPDCRKLLENAPLFPDHLCESCREHFAEVLKLLRAADINPVLDPLLVRGLDYYTRTTFEVTSDKIGAQTAVAGGGRYDGLLAQIGGPDLPGIGFACGMERLEMLMPPNERKPLDFFFVTPGREERENAFLMAASLRKAGFSGEMNYEDASFKSLMRQANRSGAKFCLIYGPDEAAQKKVMLKNMATGDSSLILKDDLAEALARALSA